jgi:hypothetical protein
MFPCPLPHMLDDEETRSVLPLGYRLVLMPMSAVQAASLNCDMPCMSRYQNSWLADTANTQVRGHSFRATRV